MGDDEYKLLARAKSASNEVVIERGIPGWNLPAVPAPFLEQQTLICHDVVKPLIGEEGEEAERQIRQAWQQITHT